MRKRLMRWMAPMLAGMAGLVPAGGSAATPAAWTLDSDRVFLRIAAPEAADATAMVQDSQGYLWVGTQAGLMRWDGYRFRSYALDPDAPGALPDNFITALYIDTSGRLWVGTNAGGLARYEPDRDGFRVVALRIAGGADTNVSAITGDGTGGLWVATGRGLIHVDGTSSKAEPLQDPALHGPQARVESLLRDHQGTLWAGTRHGLLRRPQGAVAFVALALPAAAGPSPVVSALFEDSGGRVWIGLREHGALMIAPGARGATPVRDPGAGSVLATASVASIAEARDGEIWLGTLTDGIVTIDAASGRAQHERHEDGQTTSLANDRILCLYRDHAGLMWVGGTNALSRYNPGQGAISTFYGGGGHHRFLGDGSVPAVLAMPDGRVWLGLDVGGIEILDPNARRVGQVPAGPAPGNGHLPANSVTALARAPDGSVFVGTTSGLYRVGADLRQVIPIDLQTRSGASDVWTLYVDGERLWVGGIDGAWELALTPGRAPALLRHLDNELGDPRVTALQGGPGGVLWIGTRSGLVRLDRSSGAVQRIAVDPIDQAALPGGAVSGLLVDRRGRLWVGTYGRGVQVQSGTGDDGRLRFRRLSARDGLPQNSVDMLLFDARGAVWVSTDDGLARIDPERLTVRAFRAEQGVGIRAYWAGSGTVAPGGEVIFGGINGLSVVHPDQLRPAIAAPRLVITEAHVGGRPVANAALLAALPLQIDANDRSLMVEFAALEFADPDHQRYRYRLQGFDADWIDTPPSRRLASYTNLPPGDYVLQMRVAGPDGEWLPALERAVHVKPAWFQRGGLRIAAVLGVALLLVGLVQLRTLYLRQRQRELQRLVAERTEELERRGVELRRSQEQLEKMAYFDTLTGLPNRRMFNDELRRLIARALRGQGGFALLLVDLDGFKQVNDIDGHDAGDALLVAVAERLTALVRENDRVARLGGDEFAVLLPDPGADAGIAATCTRMLARLAEPLELAGRVVQATASIGVARCPQQGTTADALYKSADIALYEAKRAGRNAWRWRLDEVVQA